MARKKTTATTAAKPKTKKTSTKKANTKKAVVEKVEAIDALSEAVADTTDKEAEIAVTPTKDPYEASLEQIEKYKATHNGEDPGLDLEEVKKDAMNGFTTLIIDETSGDVPDSVKMTIDLVERAAAEDGGNS